MNGAKKREISDVNMQPGKICVYVMKNDSGLAPNPFFDICTLSVCTPNHMRSNLSIGDWIIGLAGVDLGGRLDSDHRRMIYAMRITTDIEKLDSYYRKYPTKRPRLKGSAIEKAGDAFYKLEGGELVHTHETNEHCSVVPGTGIEKQDILGNRVFISRQYWYFGSECLQLPQERWATILVDKFRHASMGTRYVIGGSGVQWTQDDFNMFVAWLPDKVGMLGCPTNPYDENVGECGEATCI